MNGKYKEKSHQRCVKSNYSSRVPIFDEDISLSGHLAEHIHIEVVENNFVKMGRKYLEKFGGTSLQPVFETQENAIIQQNN